MNSKEYFFNEVLKESLEKNGSSLRVLELGCGTASYVPAMIEKYPQLEYVGIEPMTESFAKADDILEGVPRSKIIFQLGYDKIDGIEDGSFDVVISFSVLEHVKHLDAFMKLSSKYLKSGGLMIHRYDLGHALYPTGIKEYVHLFLGNNFPQVLPETKFVRYVPMDEVSSLYEKYIGTHPYRYSYHQMPNHKRLEKELLTCNLSTEALSDVHKWEFDNFETFSKLDLPMREKLFPTVSVWGRKQ